MLCKLFYLDLNSSTQYLNGIVVTSGDQCRILFWHQECSWVLAWVWWAWSLGCFWSVERLSFLFHTWRRYASIYRLHRLLWHLSHFEGTPKPFRKPIQKGSASRSFRSCSFCLQILSGLWFFHETALSDTRVLHWPSQRAFAEVLRVLSAFL